MRKMLCLFYLLICLGLTAQKYDEPIYTVSGLAIKGYDVVAYHVDGKAIKGDSDFSFDWNGSKWLFSTEDNQLAFEEDPERWIPQYGGYCAWGMSNGYKAKVDPEEAWTIFQGKLYLNYSKGIKAKWLSNKVKLIGEADKNWQKLK